MDLKFPHRRAVCEAVDESFARDFCARVLGWYARCGRDLPWRGRVSSRSVRLYRVWVAEVMLQQTRVASAIVYYRRFLRRFPRVSHLAGADLEEVLFFWQGLGYYARARNLHAAARIVSGRRRFPRTEAGWRELPGIGDYTAAAICSIGDGQPCVAIDGNIARIFSRFFACDSGIDVVARSCLPRERCGDYTEGLMDLGALICRARSPLCGECPLASGCRANAMGVVGDFPRRAERRSVRPIRRAVVFLFRSGDRLLFIRREARGLLGGLSEFPTTDWRENRDYAEVSSIEWEGYWRRFLMGFDFAVEDFSFLSVPVVHHSFTHFDLELHLAGGELRLGGRGCGLPYFLSSDYSLLAISALMRRVLGVYLGSLGEQASGGAGGRAPCWGW